MNAQLAGDLYELFRREKHHAEDVDDYEHLDMCADHWLLRAFELEEMEER